MISEKPTFVIFGAFGRTGKALIQAMHNLYKKKNPEPYLDRKNQEEIDLPTGL